MKLNIHISRTPSCRQKKPVQHHGPNTPHSGKKSLKKLIGKFSTPQPPVADFQDDKCDKACVSISTVESVSSSDSSIIEYDDTQQPPSYIECIDDKKAVQMEVERGRSREVTSLPTYRPLAPSLPPPARIKSRAPVAPHPPKFKYISQRNEYNQRIKIASSGSPEIAPLIAANKTQIIIQLPHSHIINPRTIHHITREINRLDLLNTDYNNWFTLLKLIILIWLVYISLSTY